MARNMAYKLPTKSTSNNLRFADDIIVVAKNPTELQQMLNDLHSRSTKVGLKMNKSKTKVMFNNLTLPADIKIDGQTLEHVNNYVY